ncbi:MAG: hypothetical protein JXR96_02825 [Deltaproteobacteria bacterium]|nr:hypothetical protein [Deltaproteobacteria bacterium]
MRKWIGLLPVLLLASALVSLGCSDGGNGNGECPEGQFKCSDEQCHECCNAEHCDQGEECVDFVCVVQCTEEHGDCSADPATCCTGLACDPFDLTCEAVCSEDADCVAMHSDMQFSEDLVCQDDGTCNFDPCANDAACPPGRVCFEGKCVSPVDVSDVDHCTVAPASAVTRQGTTAEFAVTAFLSSGAMAPGVEFDWSSSDENVATVAPKSALMTGVGVVTGGAADGTVGITAKIAGTEVACTPVASVVNYGAVEAGHTRVVVLDELTGVPVDGAAVRIVTEGGYDRSVDTVQGGNGVADFDDIELSDAEAGTVTVSAATHNPVTAVAVESNDLILHVGVVHDPDMAGGFRGTFDYSQVECQYDSCEVYLGLAGPSIPGNLFNLNFDLLIGELIQTDIEFGGQDLTAPLPGGLVIGLNTTWFREFFTPTGVPGTRVAWGLGGMLNLGDLITKLGPYISGGTENIDVGALLVTLLPYFSMFYTALKPDVTITPMAKVLDVNDINGNERTDDLVPDYDHFPEIEPDGKLHLNAPMDQHMTFSIGTLPSCGDGFCYDGVIVLAGVIIKGAGLVPLGLSAGMDAISQEETPDGHIDDIAVSLSDVAGRLPEDQVQRVVVALALSISSLMGDEGGELALAGNVMFVDTFTGSHGPLSFMQPADVTFDATGRTATLTALPAAADYMHMIFTGEGDATWQVMADKATDGTVFDIPEDPASGTYLNSLNFVAIDLDGIDYQDIPAFNDSNMDDLVQMVSSFVFGTAAEP